MKAIGINFVISPQTFISKLKLLRVKDWSVQNGVFLLGCFFADDLLCYSIGVVVMSLLLSCLCLAYAYSLNEYFDVLQEKLVHDPVSSAQIYRLVYIFLVCALALSWFISTTTFIIIVLIAITVWLHSSPPFLLKRGLAWRLILNSLGFALFFLAGASLDNHLSTGEKLMGIFVFVLYLPLELIHVLAHMDSDKVKGFKTFALVYGQNRTIILGVIFLAALIVYSCFLWQGKFISMAFALWSIFNLLLLLTILMAAYRRENDSRMYASLRFRAKVICAVYGTGMLALLVAKI